MTKATSKNSVVCIERDSGSNTPTNPRTDLPGDLPGYPRGYPSQVISLSRFLSCPPSRSLSDLLTNPLSNLVGDSVGNPLSHSLSHLRGHPLGDTPSPSRFSYNLFKKQELRRIFTSISALVITNLLNSKTGG